MTESFGHILETFARHPGVRGSLVVHEQDGLVVDAQIKEGERGDRVAAFAASVYRKARIAVPRAGLGDTRFVQLETAGGYLCIAGAGELLFTVIADHGTNLGQLRAAMLQASVSS